MSINGVHGTKAKMALHGTGLEGIIMGELCINGYTAKDRQMITPELHMHTKTSELRSLDLYASGK